MDISKTKSYITAENAPIGIEIKTSTRYGGFSSAPYNSLNMGYFTGDDITAVIKNYYYYQNITKTYNIVTLNQIHCNTVLEVNKENAADIMFSKADGLFTYENNLPLGVITADCLPVMLAGNKCISSLHCGWRSLNAGIIDNAFKLFKKYDDMPVYAYIGAGICEQCYEVRDDFVNQLNPAYNPASALTEKVQGQYLLNMKKLASNALIYNGLSIDNIEISKYSSCCSKGFYSYRLENGKTGRMVTTIQRAVRQ